MQTYIDPTRWNTGGKKSCGTNKCWDHKFFVVNILLGHKCCGVKNCGGLAPGTESCWPFFLLPMGFFLESFEMSFLIFNISDANYRQKMLNFELRTSPFACDLQLYMVHGGFTANIGQTKKENPNPYLIWVYHFSDSFSNIKSMCLLFS